MNETSNTSVISSGPRSSGKYFGKFRPCEKFVENFLSCATRIRRRIHEASGRPRRTVNGDVLRARRYAYSPFVEKPTPTELASAAVPLHPLHVCRLRVQSVALIIVAKYHRPYRAV